MSTRAVIPKNPVAGKMRMLTRAPGSLLQRKCECGGSAEHEGECQDCKKKKLQRRATGNAPETAPAIVHDVLRSPGRPLDEQTRAFFEPRFGHDFSKVRIHTDSHAHQSARAVNAQAYTVGNDLVFSAGRFAPWTKSGQQLLAHELTHVIQQSSGGAASVQRKLEVGAANDVLEQEAERFAEQITSDSRVTSGWPVPPPSNGPKSKMQRAIADSDPSATSATTVPPASGLIVEDDASNVGQGQMRKSEFLEGLRDSVCAAADSELAAVGRTAQGCPFIERWIARLQSRTSQYIERGIRKYAPESANASAARDYFPAVGNHVRQGVRRWATSGDLSGVPPELMSEMGGGGILGAISGAISSVAGAIGGAFSGIGKLFTKAKEGGAREANPAAIQAKLGAGAALDGGVKTRMESAFGHDFSQVRVHADCGAAQLSSDVNARAFTIGNDVAFAAGEYRPGTLIGDALIAHELAHVMQQRDAASGAMMSKGGTEYSSLEEDADVSAVGAMVSLWTGAKSAVKSLGQNAGPRLRSGLRLQRCGGANPEVRKPEVKQSVQQGPAAATATTPRTDAFGKECPDTVEIGELKPIPPFKKSMLNDGFRTYFGVLSSMKVGPKPSYEACITEVLEKTEDTCGSGGNLATQHHCGKKDHCMLVGKGGSDGLKGKTTYVSFSGTPNAFIDLHRSYSEQSLLEGSEKAECQVTCLQRYGCGGQEIGRFLITRHFKASQFSDGTNKVSITEGTIEKRPAPK